MCNTVIPGRYCECGKVLETFPSYIEQCVAVTQDPKKKPGDCGEMNEMQVPEDWGSCRGGCSFPTSPTIESTPATTPEANLKAKPEKSRGETLVASSKSSTRRPKSAEPPVALRNQPSAASEEREKIEKPPAFLVSTSKDISCLLTKLIHSVEYMSVALQDIKSQMDRTAGIGLQGSDSQGAGRVIIIETATDIDNVVKRVLQREYPEEKDEGGSPKKGIGKGQKEGGFI